MAYDRDEFRNRPFGRDRSQGREPYSRDERRSSGEHYRDHERGHRDEERGFFERAGDEIASWFGGEDDDRGGHPEPRGERAYGAEGWRERPRGEPGSMERNWRPDYGAIDRGRSPSSSRDRSSRDPSRSRDFDPHYRSWRDQQIEALDRDYDEYRREHQSRFENEFGGWRERRMSKRQMMGSVREHMDVIGNDELPVGTVDRVAGDRIILTKSNEAEGSVHHSLSCADVDRIEENRIILDCTAEDAKQRWRDENRSRALFEREDQGEIGPRILDRSFEGTYRR